MDVSTTLSLVQTILTAIQTLGLMHSVCSISNCESELDDLHNTVETVRAVLMDADTKQDSLNFQEKNYIQELKDAVYDADDVLDEFLTLAKQKQLRRNKVKSFFSRFKLLTHRLSSKVKMVNDKLNTIATKSDKFSFKVDCKPLKFTKEETSSFMCDKIIGREEDVEKIVGVLLGSHNVDQPNVSLLAIMGMGGLGKTALAQLVYNDPRICNAFRLKKWTCIADQDEQQWSLKAFLGKVVKGPSIDDKSSLEEIHLEVKGQLEGKKYLLVLDDVWTESYEQWQQVEGFLKVGGRGSWIIVTTRSKTTAQMIGGDRVHVLQGLSEPESWLLFERMTFQTEERDDELVKLGKEIVKKCANVPLAIRVVASLLRGQSKSKWLSFHDKGLAYLSESNDTMTRILKLSYDQLNPSLKACFAYCAIFPKDWEISKQTLVQLWMAQGYINSENLGEEYFLILLQRCFFQDLPEDEFGGIDSFKIHDLLHDLAERVAGEEICRFSFDTSNVGKRVRHLSFPSNSYAQHIINNSHIRTCLQLEGHLVGCTVEQLLARKSMPKWTWLRSLDLSFSEAKSLPKSIGQLLHLRNLDLSFSRQLECLPKSITKLVNLQTLLLDSCTKLKQLPNDVSKLVDLSTLNVAGCHALSHMPVGIGMLTCLQNLCQFVVGAPATSSTSDQCFKGLEDLQHLNRLKGSLTIEIAVLENAKFVKEEQGGGGYLRSKEHLETIVINFRYGDEYGSKESEQALLEEMQPHPNVKTLMVFGYHGETIPRWPRRGDNTALFDLPNLVTLEIRNCVWLLYLPWQVGKLPRLKTLDISDLWNMEYLMDADSETFISGEESSFFPSLQNLRIKDLFSLKGWWRRTESLLQVVNPNGGGNSGEAHQECSSYSFISLLTKLVPEKHLEWVSSPCFPVLKELTIEYCEGMNFVPLCPQLEHLEIDDSARKLLWTDRRSTTHHDELSSSLSYPNSKQLDINKFEWLKSMSVKYTRFLSEINVTSDWRCESLGEVKELSLTPLLSSLRTLRIKDCLKLESVGGWLEHLSALENLSIDNCPKVVLDGMSWRNLAGTLQYLELAGMYEMEKLPEGMQYCTSLRSLYIWNSPTLNSLPKWMPMLTSLQTLKLQRRLFERCQQPNGEDWPLIRHISKLHVSWIHSS
ncbi:disease resistance protein RGA2-like [Silene latifolia]|uniref:disease resistance protein RGA2-like n=1 Tax=Silene latifolia TaxID=37657 RepID=UPI003D778C49